MLFNVDNFYKISLFEIFDNTKSEKKYYPFFNIVIIY